MPKSRTGSVFVRASLVLLAAAALLAVSCVWVPANSLEAATAAETAANTAGAPQGSAAAHAWWFWPLVLFIGCFFIGILAVLGGTGGGVIFVPLLSTFSPFHLDFIRGAGLLMAMAGALAAGPELLTRNLARFRLVLPAVLVASIASIAGAMLGLALPAWVSQLVLGIVIICIAGLMCLSHAVERPRVGRMDLLATILKIGGKYREETTGEDIEWRVHRTPLGLALFSVVGLVSGMLGLGAGWANVPVFNLVLGVPLKVAVGSSVFLISINATAGAWVYLHQGAVIPLIAVPSMLGIMSGTRVGVKLLARTRPTAVRYFVVVLLLTIGIRSLLTGLGI